MAATDANESVFRRTSLLVGLAVLTAVIAGADYLYFDNLEAHEPAAQEQVASAAATPAGVPAAPVASAMVCAYDSSKKPVKDHESWVTFSDPSLGNPDAPVTVIEFFDPNCPHCKTIHPVMKAAADSLGDKARFVFRPFALGRGSFLQVEALHIAAQQGKFFEMLDAQFERQNPRGLGMDAMEEISAEIGLDFDVLKKRIESQMYRSTMLRHRQVAYEAGVNVVPTLMINGRITESSARSIACLSQMIDEAS